MRRGPVGDEAGDRQRQVEEHPRVGAGDLAPAGDDLGQRVERHAEDAAQLGGPVAAVQVVQQRARGVGDVGDVLEPAGHPRHQVGVERADGVPALLDQRPGAWLVLGQPGQGGPGGAGGEAPAGQLGDAGLVTRGAQPLAHLARTPVLPGDRPPGRAQRLAVPQQHRVALVGDRDRGQLAGLDPVEHLADRAQHGLPDLLGGVLDLPRGGPVLRQVAVAPRPDGAGGVDGGRRDAGGGGVDRQHAGRHAAPPRTTARMRRSIQDRSGATRIS